MIELMVTVAVAAILLAIAAPAMKTMISGRAVAAQATELSSALHFARAEAMKRSAPVTICKVDPTTVAPTACSTAAAATWQSWMVFSENAGTGSNQIGVRDASEPVLRQQFQAPTTLVSWQPATPAGLLAITFQSTGIAMPYPTTLAMPTRLLVHPVMSAASSSSEFRRNARQVCLNSQGRAEVIDGNATCP
jgi:Tfp pilus assembly protein FimT